MGERSPARELEPALVDALGVAIPSTLAALAAAHPGERLTGYALCTDDCLCTVFHVALTHETTTVENAFAPNEWTFGEGDAHLADAQAAIVASYERHGGDDEFAAHVERCFDSLVEALVRARAAGHFAHDVFLEVLSTDPSPDLRSMSEAASLRLNPPEVVRRWRAWRLGELESALEQMAADATPPSYWREDLKRELEAEAARLRAELADTPGAR